VKTRAGAADHAGSIQWSEAAQSPALRIKSSDSGRRRARQSAQFADLPASQIRGDALADTTPELARDAQAGRCCVRAHRASSVPSPDPPRFSAEPADVEAPTMSTSKGRCSRHRRNQLGGLAIAIADKLRATRRAASGSNRCISRLILIISAR